MLPAQNLLMHSVCLELSRRVFRLLCDTLRSPLHRDALAPPAVVREAAAPAGILDHWWPATCHLTAAPMSCPQLPHSAYLCRSLRGCARSAVAADSQFDLPSACRPAPQRPPALPQPLLSRPCWLGQLRPARPLSTSSHHMSHEKPSSQVHGPGCHRQHSICCFLSRCSNPSRSQPGARRTPPHAIDPDED